VVTAAADYACSGYGSAKLGNKESQRGLSILEKVGTGVTTASCYEQFLGEIQFPDRATGLAEKWRAVVKGLALGSLELAMAAMGFMLDLRRSWRPQAYATGGTGETLWGPRST
jgi:hypothetical protein